MLLLTLMKHVHAFEINSSLALAVTTVQERDFILSYLSIPLRAANSLKSQNWTAFDYKAKLLVVIYILKHVLSFLLTRLSGRTMSTNLYFVGGGDPIKTHQRYTSPRPLYVRPLFLNTLSTIIQNSYVSMFNRCQLKILKQLIPKT